jgi:hypothetical protein
MADSDPKLYRIEDQGSAYFVVARSIADAVVGWREIFDVGGDEEDGSVEPTSITVVSAADDLGIWIGGNCDG